MIHTFIIRVRMIEGVRTGLYTFCGSMRSQVVATLDSNTCLTYKRGTGPPWTLKVIQNTLLSVFPFPGRSIVYIRSTQISFL